MTRRSRPGTRSTSRLLLIAAAALAASACNQSGKPERQERTSRLEPRANEERTAEPSPDRRPERARLEALEEESEAAKPAAQPKDGITRAWFAGKWTDTGDCAEAGQFDPNGTYRLADGTRGMWSVRDGQLVVQNAEGRSAFKLRRVSDDAVEVLNEDGSAGRSQRC